MASSSHPFLNVLIAENMLKLVDRRELPNFRTVCKIWDFEALAELRRSVPLIIQADEENLEVDYVPRLLSGAPPGATYIRRSLKEMVEYMESLPDADQEKRLRYSTVVLQGWDFTSPSDQQMTLFEACCGGTKDLHLIRCRIDITFLQNILMTRARKVERLSVDDTYLKRGILGSTKLREILFGRIIGPVTVQKNLKSLTILCSEKGAKVMPQQWSIFFQSLPNLEKVVLTYLTPLNGNPTPEWNLDDFGSMKAVGVLLGLATFGSVRLGNHKLRQLDLSRLDSPASGFLRPCVLGALKQNTRLPLSVLKIDIGAVQSPYLQELTVPELIHEYVGSLETLVVIRAPFTMNFLQPITETHDFKFLQIMETLKTLELVGSVAFNLKFLRFTPNLRKLVVTPMHRTKYAVDLTDDDSFRQESSPLHRMHPHYMNLVMDAEEELSGVVLASLTELEVGYPLQGPESVALLGKWMPNVETLKIPATPAIFTEICRQWGNSLRKLYLQNPTVIDDHVITGHPNAAPELSSPQLPNVTSLTNMTSFQMEHPYSSFQCDHLIPELTERSIVHGFAHLEGLQNLKIFVTAPLGEQCLQTLDARRGLLSVVTEVVGNCQCRTINE